VELVSFLTVANRLIDPSSKLAMSRWYKKKVYLRELENTDFALMTFIEAWTFWRR